MKERFSIYLRLFILSLSFVFVFGCYEPAREFTVKNHTLTSEGSKTSQENHSTTAHEEGDSQGYEENSQSAAEGQKPTVPTPTEEEENQDDQTVEEESKPFIPTPPPVVDPLADFFQIELDLMQRPFEEVLKNSQVFVLFDDSSQWFFYNQLKMDRENPQAAQIYEAIIKMICAGSYVKEENYPRKYAFDETPNFNNDFQNAIRSVEYDHPEFFYLQLSHTYHTWSGDKVIFHIEGLYNSLEELRADETKAFEGAFVSIQEFKERMIQYHNRPYPEESKRLKGSALVDEQIHWLHDAYAYACYYHSKGVLPKTKEIFYNFL